MCNWYNTDFTWYCNINKAKIIKARGAFFVISNKKKKNVTSKLKCPKFLISL